MTAQVDREMAGRVSAAFLKAVAAIEIDGSYQDIGLAMKAEFSPEEYDALLDIALPLAASDLTRSLNMLVSNANPLGGLLGGLFG